MHPPPINESCMGYCSDCDTTHSLQEGNAVKHAEALIEEFKTLQRLDYLSTNNKADPDLSFKNLFRGTQGHMFGVLECLDQDGQTVILRAFSSLYGGIRHIEGWVPPILSSQIWDDHVLPAQAKIKALTPLINNAAPDSKEHEKLFEERKQISHTLMLLLQEKLHFTNFRGETRKLTDTYNSDKKIPGGIGDCCGPKLLNYAALNKLKPVGLAEFYWGEPTPDGSKVQGQFYPCCKEKCQPILGFILCGLDEI